MSDNWSAFIRWFQRVDGTTAYRLAMFFIVLSVTPFSSFLPKIDGFKPLWATVNDFQESNKETQKKIDEAIRKVDNLNVKAEGLETRVLQIENEVSKTQTLLTGFQVDFERYRKTQPNQPEGPAPVTPRR